MNLLQLDIEQDLQLPLDWEWIRLGQRVRKIGSGSTPQGGHSVYQQAGIPLIRSQNVHMNQFVYDGLAYISPEIDKIMAQSRVEPGDVLLNITGASIGRVCLPPDDLCPANVNQHVSIIRTDDTILPAFLSYLLSSPIMQKYINDLQAGATRQALTKSQIEDFVIPLPPLTEQKRIVAILDEKLAAVKRARAAAQAQLQAAQALPAAYLRTVFESDEAHGWPECRMGDVLVQRREMVHPQDNPRGSAIFVGLEHIESLVGVRSSSIQVEMSQLTGRKPKFYKGDIVYGYLRPYLNKVWIAEFDGLCSVDQYVYTVDSTLVDAEFVAWFMRSSVYLKRAPVDATPGQLPRIRTEEVAAVEINLPPIMKQKQIAQEIQVKLKEARGLMASLQEQLDAVEQIPAALLRQAFTGDL